MTKARLYTVSFQKIGVKRDGSKHICKHCIEELIPGDFQFVRHGYNPKTEHRWINRFHAGCFPKFVFMVETEHRNKYKAGRPKAEVKTSLVDNKEWTSNDLEVRNRRRVLMLYMHRDLRLYARNSKEKKLHDFSKRLVEFNKVGYFKDIKGVMEKAFHLLPTEAKQKFINEVKSKEGSYETGEIVEWFVQAYPPREELAQDTQSITVQVTDLNRQTKTGRSRRNGTSRRTPTLPRRLGLDET